MQRRACEVVSGTVQGRGEEAGEQVGAQLSVFLDSGSTVRGSGSVGGGKKLERKAGKVDDVRMRLDKVEEEDDVGIV